MGAQGMGSTSVHERYSKLYETLASLEDHVIQYNDLREKDREAISAYINLCAEQFHWRHSEKLIDDSVWEVWEAAIKAKLNTPAIRAAWKHAHSKDVYYQGFSDFVDRSIRQ